jgi:hypothetical protein
MSMQMGAYLKKEQIGTLFVRVGALEGGFRGRGGGESSPKIIRAYPFFFVASCFCAVFGYHFVSKRLCQAATLLCQRISIPPTLVCLR